MDITPEQITAARHLLRIRQRDFARQLGISPSTLCTYERGLQPSKSCKSRIVQIFKDAGIEFINENGSVGVVKRNGLV